MDRAQREHRGGLLVGRRVAAPQLAQQAVDEREFALLARGVIDRISGLVEQFRQQSRQHFGEAGVRAEFRARCSDARKP